MNDLATTTNDLFQLGNKIAQVYTRRLLAAQKSFVSSFQATAKSLATTDGKNGNIGQAWCRLRDSDWLQRWVLFGDTLRQRGNNYLAHERG